MTNRVGQQLGNYRLVSLLGRGGFAEVYLGEHVHLETQAAVKVLHTQVGSNELELFRKEARTIARLEHPRIVRVLEFGVENDSPYLVMTYAPNGTLRQRHPKGEQLPLKMILPYVKQVAEALQYIHNQKLIHRDVKPENLLLDSSDNILVSDFGIASVAHTTISLTTQGQAGTPHYMAPEQIMNKPGPASDQYALGVVVYEWLCGIRPFQGDVFNIFFQHLQTPPLALRERLSTIPPLVEIVVLKALTKDPKQRFASVRAFANALEQASKAELAAPLIVLGTSIAPGSTTHMAEVDTKSDQLQSPGQLVPPAGQPSLPTEVVVPDKQPQPAIGVAHPFSSPIPASQIVPLPDQPSVSTSSHQQTSMPFSASQSGRLQLPKRNLLRLGIPVGIFLIGLALAFYFSNTFGGHLFLPILSAGLAFASLFNAASPSNLRGIYAGLYPFIWLLGLAICFLLGFWPWILAPFGLSLVIFILGKRWHVPNLSLQQQYRRLVRGTHWFWTILAIFLISLISGRIGGFVSHNFGSGQNPIQKSHHFTVSGQPTIVINDANGAVQVNVGSSNSDVVIQTVQQNSFFSTPDRIQPSVSQNANTINSSVPASQQGSVDFAITVPQETNLQLQTDSGDISVNGVDGQMTLTTNSGSINMSNDMMSGSSKMTTNSGDIVFNGTFSSRGTYQFQTVSGSIDFSVPGTSVFHIDASTNSGSINANDFPSVSVQNNSATGAKASGDVGGNQNANVTINTDSGDINLHKR